MSAKTYCWKLRVQDDWVNDTTDCRECQEKAEGYLAEIQTQAALIARLDKSLDLWREACAENKRRSVTWRKRARKWKRRCREAWKVDALAVFRERDEALARVRELEEWKAEWCASRADQVSRLVVEKQAAERERDEARADTEHAWELVAQGVIGHGKLMDELDALKVRARGMREALMHGGKRTGNNGTSGLGLPDWKCLEAAGEPIP